MMKVYCVFFRSGDWEEKELLGIFSSPDLAQTHIDDMKAGFKNANLKWLKTAFWQEELIVDSEAGKVDQHWIRNWRNG